MTSDTDTATSATQLSQVAARVSLAATALFVLLLAALHFVEPEFDPSWRVISEYALGEQGWMMVLAFLSLALGCTSLAIALRPHLPTKLGTTGLAFLLIAAVGLVIAAIFTTDPITATEAELTTHGDLHALGAALGIGLPIAAALISWSLARTQAPSSARRSLVWAAAVAWIGVVAFSLSTATLIPQNGSVLGPDVLIGWPNRLMMAGYSWWLLAAAWYATPVGDKGD